MCTQNKLCGVLSFLDEADISTNSDSRFPLVLNITGVLPWADNLYRFSEPQVSPNHTIILQKTMYQKTMQPALF